MQKTPLPFRGAGTALRSPTLVLVILLPRKPTRPFSRFVPVLKDSFSGLPILSGRLCTLDKPGLRLDHGLGWIPC